ncbi:GerAB/ArcD/ProY family transporter [Paenibacillus sp. M1]|uniref:GerAB/ArcD/ProY family transporter n=1 Tax=Paenibacillus haidiansis TaxID=1574488 RepID=A0ABU7VXJ1_9BACL
MSQEKLRPLQIAMLFHNTQVGVVLFILPRTIAIHFGTNGWVILPIMFVIVTLNIVLINSVYRLGGGASVFTILKSGLPRFLLIPLYFVIGCALAMVGCLVVKQYSLMYQMLIFPQTPDMLLKLVIDILVFLLVTKGIYNMSKANVFFLTLTLLMIPFAFEIFKSFDPVRMTPFFFQEGKDMGRGLLKVFSAFMGYELAIFLFPYAESGKRWLKYLHFSNAFTAIIYLLVTILCYGFFSYKELTHLSFPLLEMFGYLHFPFAERVQNFLFSFFLLSILNTSAMYYWSSQTVFKEILPKLNWKWITFILLAATFAVSYIPKALIVVEQWFDVVTYFQMGVAVLLPLLALLALLLRKGKKVHA